MYRSTADAIDESVPDQPLLKLKKYMSVDNGEVQEVDCNEEVTIVGGNTPKPVRCLFFSVVKRLISFLPFFL